jgi:hypothetical protein
MRHRINCTMIRVSRFASCDRPRCSRVQALEKTRGSNMISELLKSLETLSSEDLGRLYKAVLQEGTKRKLPWASQEKSGTILAGHP